MYSKGIIKKISILNFRSHSQTSINSSEKNIVLFGDNGAGKTNILEAISLLAPGKGMRSSKYEDMLNIANNSTYFELKFILKVDQGEVTLTQKYLNQKDKISNSYYVDEEKIASNSLLNYLRIIWVTPVMEKVMLQNYSEKRNFFDRLIFNINKNHLKNIRNLNKFLKERIHLLEQGDYDDNWISIIEKKIVTTSYLVLSERNKVIELINQKLIQISEPFTSCKIVTSYKSEENFFSLNEDQFIVEYLNILKLKRNIDKEISRTTVNVNSVKFDIFKAKGSMMDSKDCSTGEQKSMLISIILSVCRIIKSVSLDTSLIILIDEAMAHFDEKHRSKLFDELNNLNCQTWYSGVSKELFKSISDQTIFFEVKNNV